MDLDLESFALVVAAGSLSAAARRAGISPGMMSKRISRLETRLGVQLLHRTTRRLELTARGERFHRDVVRISDDLRQAEDRLTDNTEPKGVLKVAAPTSFGRMHVARQIKPFLDQYPEIELELNLSDGFDDLPRDAIDVAIRITSSVSTSLVADRLAGSRRILCAAPAYLKSHGTPHEVADLSRHRMLAAVGQLPWRLCGADGNITVDGVSHVRTNSSEVVRELTLAGTGVALRSLWDISQDLASGALVRVLEGFEGASDVAIYAVRPRGRTSRAAAAFVEALKNLWSPRPPWEDKVVRP